MSHLNGFYAILFWNKWSFEERWRMDDEDCCFSGYINSWFFGLVDGFGNCRIEFCLGRGDSWNIATRLKEMELSWVIVEI